MRSKEFINEGFFGQSKQEFQYSKSGVGLAGVGEPNGSEVEYNLDDEGHITDFKIIGGQSAAGFPLTDKQISAATQVAKSDMARFEQAITGASAFPNLKSNTNRSN